MLQYEFQSFFVTAEKPNLGLAVTIASGVTNIILDALLVAVFPLGLKGAAARQAWRAFYLCFFSIFCPYPCISSNFEI